MSAQTIWRQSKYYRRGSTIRSNWCDSELRRALVNRDEEAFSWLVNSNQTSMIRVAQRLLGNKGLAEEVVQETFEAIFREIGRFRGEASLRNWMFRILINRARRVGTREGRSVPFCSLNRRSDGTTRDLTPDEVASQGDWSSPVHGWYATDPQEEVINRQEIELLGEQLQLLPERQRVLVELRDVQELDSDEVCEMLDISPGNQRVLLHRGRTMLRRVRGEIDSTVDNRNALMN